ncbi:hypothetical protein HHK36_005492 [Tetracentron sinense]|uniref:non-specific serine/threonine protein kinase n=1 Tax=Tetracentron sinense TaxID=13715 RepID=A0A834ZU96_TETSI|nr:hypothetical protein HHK36_005492 [Tetracentron sinense]
MRKVIVIQSYIILCFILLLFLSNISIAVDTITPTQAVRDGVTLVSTGERFELGFFSPGNSKNRYVGIWYKQIPIATVVWVANRDNPLTNSSGILRIGDEGNLILLNKSEGSVIWSSNQSKADNPNQSKADNPVAQLLDSGNLVIREAKDKDPKNYLWQSFDHPTDTMLPGMKLGWNLKTGMNRNLTSWKSEDDPSTGDYSYIIKPNGFPQAFLLNQQVPKYRSGPWNGHRFSGAPQMKPNYIFNFNFTSNQEEVYYSFSLKDESLVARFMVNHTGLLERSTWLETNRVWNILWYIPKDPCDNYGQCGPYGICDTNAWPICKCVEGFEPKNPDNWYLRDGSGGCIRKSKFDCQNGSGFLRLRGMKLPDTSLSFADKSMTLKECEALCRKNCACTGYANSDITQGGIGCVIWRGDLLDLREFTEDGQDVYVRVAASELDSGKKKKVVVIVIVTVGAGVLLFGLSIVCFIRKRKTMLSIPKGNTEERGDREKSQDPLLFDVVIPRTQNYSDENKKDDLELTLFDFSTIAAATDHFSDANMVGQGGFGCVYKVWRLWREGKAVTLLDSSMGDSFPTYEVLRCIQVIKIVWSCTLKTFYAMANPADTITPTQTIRDGQTLVSSGQRFELGFFSPGNSKNRYVGIWYNQITNSTVVWVANRDNPLTNSSGILRIGDEGNLILLNKSEGSVIWWSNQSKADNPVVQLLDSGNLVIREENDENPENYLWQSFDHPTDTLLPGMKLGWNFKTRMNRYLTSWKSEDDPSSGDYSFRIEPHGFPEAFLWNRLERKYRSGPWNGLRFSGAPEMNPNYIFNFSFTSNKEEVYYSFSLMNDSFISRLMVNHSGLLQRYTWLENSRVWNLFWYSPKEICDFYGECGAYGICDMNASPQCKCLKGFEPKNPGDWYLRDGSGGCIKKSEFDCHKGYGFLRLKRMKLPDASHSFADKSMTLKECKALCRKNCSCTAYANSDITGGGTGCVIWTGDLLDLREFTEGGQDLYVRVAASELDSAKSKRVGVIVIVTVGVCVLLFGLSVWFIRKKQTMLSIWKENTEARGRGKSQDPLLFDVVIPVRIAASSFWSGVGGCSW